MKTKHTLIQLCLLVALLLALLTAVLAQFTYTTNADDTLTITGYTGSNGVVTIPSTIAGLPVTSIGDWAFYATSVTNVLIPDSVTNIGDGAFFDCQSLTNVTIGNSVTSIGDWTFAFCPSLTSVCCRGNAPGLGGGNVFYGNLATIYYLSGATDWGPMFDGIRQCCGIQRCHSLTRQMVTASLSRSRGTPVPAGSQQYPTASISCRSPASGFCVH